MPTSFHLGATEHVEAVVAMPPDEVEAHLRTLTSAKPAPLGDEPFSGTIGNRRFHLRLRRFSRRNLRPTATGQLAPLGGLTRVTARVELPWWARPVGRGLVVTCLILGATVAAALLIGGQPSDMPTPMYYMMLAAAAWMPFVGMLLPGMLVYQALEERTAMVAHLNEVFAKLPQPTPETDATAESAAAQTRAPQRQTE